MFFLFIIFTNIDIILILISRKVVKNQVNITKKTTVNRMIFALKIMKLLKINDFLFIFKNN